MFSASFTTWLKQLQQQALLLKQRRLVVLLGDVHWSLDLLHTQAGFVKYVESVNRSTITEKSPDWLVYSDNELIPSNVSRQNYRDKLGTECKFILFSDSQFNIDALAALSGTLIAGGVLFLLLPELNNKSTFLQRFIDKVLSDEQVAVIEQSSEELPMLSSDFINDSTVNIVHKTLQQEDIKLESANQSNQRGNASTFFKCATEEQYQAVQLINKVVSGHRNRPLVLTADRGRGKSSALAIACAQLLLSSKQTQHIVITAPHRQALDVFFMQLKVCLPEAEFNLNKVITENGIIEFIAVDQLIKSDLKISLLLVDEAAAIPVYLLIALTTQYHRIVFSSTQHGYEGSGRGFAYKFQKHLTRTCPQWRLFHINQPIRWAENDPLERFIFNTCLLAAELPDVENISRESSLEGQLDFVLLSAQELIENEEKLEQVFSILVTAHYQTSPSDLRLLLDNDNVYVVALVNHEKLVAVTLLIQEGGCSVAELQAVQESKRRLKDQFLPQSLLTHCGIKNSFDFQYLRIMRIAVHPELQGQGIGSYFLTQIEKFAQQQDFDFIGSSFGANQTLVNFWQRADFNLARLGFTQDKASGEHSALVLKALNQPATLLQEKIIGIFYQSFDYLLVDEYQLLPSDLVWQILHFCPEKYLPKLTESDLSSVEDFSKKTRLYSTCSFGLHRWLLHQITSSFEPSVLPLIARILQKQSIATVSHHYAYSGKKELNQHLVNFVDKYYQQ